MRNDEAELGWLKHLPEAGSIVDLFEREKKLLDERAKLIAKLNEIDCKLTGLRDEAAHRARAGWSKTEISHAESIDAAE